MIYDLKPYPTYNDSGVPWLESVPAGWRVFRAKHVFRVLDIRSQTGEEELLTVSSGDGVVPRSQKTVTMFKAESYVGHKLCWPGDLVVNSLWAWMQGLGFARHHGLVSSAYSVYRPSEEFREYASYFHYALRSAAYKWELMTRSKGVWLSRLQLSDPAFLDMPILLPPPPEQSAIVRFLDHVDRRIRRYIRAKRRLVALLNEQKQAIIHRAVTRGLDPNVRLKPSGVEWLGKVPDHWEVQRLKTLVRKIDQGVSPQAENYLADRGTWGVLKAGCVNRGVFRDSEHKRLPTGFAIDPSLAVGIGDVLVSRASGSPHLVGSVGRVQALTYRLILSDKTFRPVFNQRADPDFMVLAMNCRYYRHQVEQAISGAEGLANNLPLSSLRTFVFAVPPTTEQRAVVEYARGLTSPLTGAVQRAEREISLLREYRTRLIADVVSGKLDVREVAASLPEEPEEHQALDETEMLAEDEEAADDEIEAVAEEAEA